MVDDFKHYFGTQIYLPLLKQANERLQRSDAPEAEAFRLSNQLQETLPRAQADQIMMIWWQVQGSIRVKRLIQFHIFCYHLEEQVLIWCSLQIQMVGQEPCLEMGQSSHI